MSKAGFDRLALVDSTPYVYYNGNEKTYVIPLTMSHLIMSNPCDVPQQTTTTLLSSSTSVSHSLSFEPCNEIMSSPSCSESFGNKVESTIAGAFSRIGNAVGAAPRKTLALAILLTVICGAGFVTWETENRGEELWVPQNTQAEKETINYEEYFGSTTRFNTMIVQASVKQENVLTKERLVEAMQMHQEIETNQAVVDGVTFTLTDLCAKSGGSCVSGPSAGGICQCLISSILRQWNYNLETLQNDTDFMQTLNQYGSREDLQALLGNPFFEDSGELVSAEAFTLSYFLTDRSEIVDGTEEDPVNEGWEKDVFLAAAESEHTNIAVDYFSARSFADEFGEAISGDLLLVQVSYVMAFLFLGATLGNIRCGTGSRWSMSLAALVTVGLSTAAGFGLSSAFGLFFGPVHSLLLFILLGIGVDDAFVIVTAFNREWKTIRTAESNTDLAKRAGVSLRYPILYPVQQNFTIANFVVSSLLLFSALWLELVLRLL